MNYYIVILSLFYSLCSQAQGVWVTRYALKEKRTISSLLTFVQKNRITDVFIQVRGRGDAYYSSEVEQNDVHSSSEENLVYLIGELKRLNIKSHAWLNTFLIASHTDQVEDETNHILNRFPHWLDYTVSLKRMTRTDAVEGLYISPANRGVLYYYKQLVNELITQYAFDGIHLDYFRKASAMHGFHPKFRDAFYAKTGKRAEEITRGIYQTYHAYTQFLADQYTQFLADLTASSNHVIWSVAVKPDIELAKNEYSQDWLRWIKEDLVNFVIPMNYTPEHQVFNQRIETYTRSEKDKIWVGIATYNQPLNEIKKRIAYTKKHRFNVTIFSFNDLKDKAIMDILN